jgi:hypothetical protein
MGTFRESFFILYSRRPEGGLRVNQERMRKITPKIPSSLSPVKGKFAGRIPLEDSSYDESSEALKNFGGTTLRIAP